MKVIIEKSRTFRVSTEDGEPLGEFVQSGGAWNGLVCLCRDDGDRIIIQAPHLLTDLFGGLESREAVVVTASFTVPERSSKGE